ncbi:MAG: CapA family protein [Candidatus Pacebacteria bacterium]|nr:CapA family protein [Candidatus Paceibacterota bacterium]
MKNQLSNNKEITILFGGDFYCKNIPKIDKKVIEIFNQADYSMVNLEAPILNNKSQFNKRLKSGPSIYQKEEIIEILKQLKIQHVGGANNHIMDFGIKGIQSTTSALDKNNIFYAGFGINPEKIRSPLVLKNTKIQILCLGEEEFGASKKNSPGHYSVYGEEVLDQIKHLKSSDKFIIIFAHGGGEEIPLPSSYIRDRFQQFIDNGADLVLGHHPHVPQGYERYKDKLIFYSLGNFIHSSYNESIGILLKVVIFNSKVKSFEIIPIKTRRHMIDIGNYSELDDYINLSNKILQNNLLRESVLQEQAEYMFTSYYRYYLKNIFSFKRSLKSLLKRCAGIGKMFGELESNFLLLLLLRNKSHREFIETALKIRTKEIKDLRSNVSEDYFRELINYINKFIGKS